MPEVHGWHPVVGFVAGDVARGAHVVGLGLGVGEREVEGGTAHYCVEVGGGKAGGDDGVETVDGYGLAAAHYEEGFDGGFLADAG